MDLAWELVLTEYFTPDNGGRSYSSERVVARYHYERAAQATANQYNMEAPEGQYYSIRKVEN